jgi:hypothetical protein
MTPEVARSNCEGKSGQVSDLGPPEYEVLVIVRFCSYSGDAQF